MAAHEGLPSRRADRNFKPPSQALAIQVTRWMLSRSLPSPAHSRQARRPDEPTRIANRTLQLPPAPPICPAPTLSGGWIGGAVILGDTGISMSVRGEQFWLDRTRAAQLRPRSRPRYTLTPRIVALDGRPMLALGTPGGDNQEQTILQTLLNIVEFHDAWYPNLHSAIEWPRVQTLHFYASFWPHDTGFNRINIESDFGPGVIGELERRGHQVRVRPPLSISGCATAVMLDPATGNRIAAADPRRDCYAMAY